jgi:N utilization substance protein A
MNEPTDIVSAIRQIAAERKIDPEEILTAVKDALKAGFKREYDLTTDEDPLEVELDPEGGHIAVYVKKSVVNKVEDEKVEISLKEAKEIDKDSKLGDIMLIDITPEGDFGRIAAQTARQIILQKLRESEKESAIREIQDKVGSIEAVTIQKITREGDVICEINRARAIMPKDERVTTEFYQLGSRVKVLLKSIEEDTRGKFVLVSRSDPDFLRELFRVEVPEIDSGTVEIVAIARDAGSRSKVAVKSNSDGIDPIGSCVGQKGVRINSIMNELKLGNHEEKVDIILWDDETRSFLMNAIRPAEALDVTIVDEDEKLARILVPNDQHSLAIGRDGQNARLASKLTGWNIDIESDGENDNADEKVEDVDDSESEDISESEESDQADADEKEDDNKKEGEAESDEVKEDSEEEDDNEEKEGDDEDVEEDESEDKEEKEELEEEE